MEQMVGTSALYLLRGRLKGHLIDALDFAIGTVPDRLLVELVLAINRADGAIILIEHHEFSGLPAAWAIEIGLTLNRFETWRTNHTKHMRMT